MNKHSGFTLIEISIVLGIIGLILGAVMLSSTDVIGKTKTTGTLSLIKDLSAAITDFKGRYHYLPGDLPKAANDIPNLATGSKCDISPNLTIGNGQIDTADEKDCVAVELLQAGLIKGNISGIMSPYNRGQTPDVFVLTTNQSAGVETLVVPTFAATVQNAIEIRNIPCDAATAIDNKIDDGNATTGNVISSACGASGLTTLDVAL